MTLEEYGCHLQGQLCWTCHCPTHASHALQRQCPICRRKWSYRRLAIEWQLLEAAASKETASKASRRLGVGYRTVLQHYARFFQGPQPHLKAAYHRRVFDSEELRTIIYERCILPSLKARLARLSQLEALTNREER